MLSTRLFMRTLATPIRIDPKLYAGELHRPHVCALLEIPTETRVDTRVTLLPIAIDGAEPSRVNVVALLLMLSTRLIVRTLTTFGRLPQPRSILVILPSGLLLVTITPVSSVVPIRQMSGSTVLCTVSGERAWGASSRSLSMGSLSVQCLFYFITRKLG
jgi:hypothetical protein